jgi:hypothetical protein
MAALVNLENLAKIKFSKRCLIVGTSSIRKVKSYTLFGENNTIGAIPKVLWAKVADQPSMTLWLSAIFRAGYCP